MRLHFQTLLLLAAAAVLRASTVTIPPGGNLQAALSAAQPGDVIELFPGATYKGPFKLPTQPTDGAVITITTSDPTTLPPSGQRIGPGANLPKIEAPSGVSAITVAANARNYVLHGLEITVTANGYAVDLVNLLSPTPTVLSSYPSNIVIDQCFIHGDPTTGGKRGIALNSAGTAVTNSYLSDFKSHNQDTQAIAGWTGPGPFVIANNYLEGGQSVLFGGAAPYVQNLVPTNIEITHNYMTRPLSWKGVWPIKNLIELKNAQDVTIADNVLENNWVSAQNGYAVLFTVRTCEAGNYAWAVVKNVSFTSNILRNSDSGVNILGTDNVRANCGRGIAGQTSNVVIRDNLFEQIHYGFLQLLSASQNITVDHNTVLNGGDIMGADGTPNTGFVFTNNIVEFGPYGVVGTGTIGALTTFSLYAPGAVFTGNAIIAAPTGRQNEYPAGNLFPRSVSAIDFGSDYELAPGSPYKYAGTDGLVLGANVAHILHATGTVVSGCDVSQGCIQ